MRRIEKLFGPYLRKQDNRKVVIIQFTNGEKTTKSYARYLLEQHLNRELKPSEDADHINENKTDDRIENLRVISHSENITSFSKNNRTRKYYNFNCPYCGKKCIKPMNYVKHNWKRGMNGPFCGKSCARQFNIGDMSKLENELDLKSNGNNSLVGSSPTIPTT